MDARDRKLYLGPRLRVLRRDLGINQTQMADELGVSPSYLNHLERNQRPLTAQMLLRLANTYDIDVRDFVAGANDGAASDLAEVFADPLVREIGIPRQEMLDVAENYPSVSEAIARLYRALLDLRRAPAMLDQIGGGSPASPIDWLRAFVTERGNHFPSLETSAEGISDGLDADPAARQMAMRVRLKERHGISVQVMPPSVMGANLRHYDFHRRRLMLAETLPAPSRLFALAYQLATIEAAEPVRELIIRAGESSEELRRLLAVALTNYAAAAIVMPYEPFRNLAEDSAYDTHRLMMRFGASFEQVAHRLTSLGRSGARGIPFFMVKVDSAGTVSKQFAGEAFPFARFGGSCPRWNIYRSFQQPNVPVIQQIETVEGKRFIALSMTRSPHGETGGLSASAIGIGCDVKYAPRMGARAAEAMAVEPTTVGPACPMCEREGCPDRAAPSLTRTLETSLHSRSAAPFAFRRV